MPLEFKLPALAENVDKVTVTRVMVAVGDTVRKDQPVMEIETDKASTEVPSAVAGTVTEIKAREGQPLRVGDVVLVVSDNGAAPAEPVAKPAPVKAEAPTPAPAPVQRPAAPVVASPVSTASVSPIPASPSVRRLAREIGIDVSVVAGTGPGGRVTMEDVKAYSRQARPASRQAAAVSAPAPAPAAMPASEATAFGEVERVPMNSVRRRTSENMTHAWTTIPHVTQFDKADITDVERFRQQYGKRVESSGGKLTVTAILVKLLATALKKFPQFNASIDVLAQEITYKKYYNIGVAVDTDRGLIVPVVRNVDTKSVIEIAVELQEMAARAREKKNRLEEMQGATFTISNLGGIGGTAFTPIVNPPEVAILGVSRGRIEPVYIDGAFQPRTMLPLSLAYDHRVIDGADAARFVRWIVDALEQPLSLLLDN